MWLKITIPISFRHFNLVKILILALMLSSLLKFLIRPWTNFL